MNLLIDIPTLANKQINVTFATDEQHVLIETILGSVSLEVVSTNYAGDMLWCDFDVDPAATMFILSPLLNGGVDVFGLQGLATDGGHHA